MINVKIVKSSAADAGISQVISCAFVGFLGVSSMLAIYQSQRQGQVRRSGRRLVPIDPRFAATEGECFDGAAKGAGLLRCPA